MENKNENSMAFPSSSFAIIGMMDIMYMPARAQRAQFASFSMQSNNETVIVCILLLYGNAKPRTRKLLN